MKYDYIVFDCDGVVWQSNEVIGQAFQNIQRLEALGKQVFFLTNASYHSRKSLASKMISDACGYDSCQISHLYTSSSLAALYLRQNMPGVKKVLYIGDKVKEELNSQGFETVDIEKWPSKPEMDCEQYLDEFEIDPEVGAVVQGNDAGLTMHMLAIALLYLSQGIPLITTNEDAFGLTKSKKLRTFGNGSIT